MDLENISCGQGAVSRDKIIPYVYNDFQLFCYILKTIENIKKCFIQKIYNKIITIHSR